MRFYSLLLIFFLGYSIFAARESISERCRLARLHIANLPLIVTQGMAKDLKLRSADFNTSVPAVLMNTPGTASGGKSNDGLFGVERSEHSSAAIKLTLKYLFDRTSLEFSERFNEYLYIHRLLGDLGYAVPLQGWIEGVELKKTIGRKDAVDPDKYIGLVMDKLPDPWNVTKSPPSPWLAKWPAGHLIKVVKRMEVIETTLNRLQIYCPAFDVQFFIYEQNGEPRVVLGDLDTLQIRKGNEFNPTDLKTVRQEVIDAWASATGKPIPKSLK